ncbi:hypothetical protein LCGC14_2213950, partial [marine sediment metagenome]
RDVSAGGIGNNDFGNSLNKHVLVDICSEIACKRWKTE